MPDIILASSRSSKACRPATGQLARHVEQADYRFLRFIPTPDGLGSWKQLNLTPFLLKERSGLWRKPRHAELPAAHDDAPRSVLIDVFGFCQRDDVRCSKDL